MSGGVEFWVSIVAGGAAAGGGVGKPPSWGESFGSDAGGAVGGGFPPGLIGKDVLAVLSEFDRPGFEFDMKLSIFSSFMKIVDIFNMHGSCIVNID